MGDGHTYGHTRQTFRGQKTCFIAKNTCRIVQEKCHLTTLVLDKKWNWNTYDTGLLQSTLLATSWECCPLALKQFQLASSWLLVKTEALKVVDVQKQKAKQKTRSLGSKRNDLRWLAVERVLKVPASSFSLSLSLSLVDWCVWLQLKCVDGQSRSKVSTNHLGYVALKCIFMSTLGGKNNTFMSGHPHPNTSVVR